VPPKKSTPTRVPPPDTAPANGGAPQVYGQLPTEVNNTVIQIRTKTQGLLLELGRLDVQRAVMVSQYNQLEAQLQGLLKIEAQRLGIPDGTTWQLTPEGLALGVPAPQESAGG
jgi:hypothetical protein